MLGSDLIPIRPHLTSIMKQAPSHLPLLPPPESQSIPSFIIIIGLIVVIVVFIIISIIMFTHQHNSSVLIVVVVSIISTHCHCDDNNHRRVGERGREDGERTSEAERRDGISRCSPLLSRRALQAIDGLVVEAYDRAAPRGVGNIKCAGNYAPDVQPSSAAKVGLSLVR